MAENDSDRGHYRVLASVGSSKSVAFVSVSRPLTGPRQGHIGLLVKRAAFATDTAKPGFLTEAR
jgi:hypothetical protein